MYNTGPVFRQTLTFKNWLELWNNGQLTTFNHLNSRIVRNLNTTVLFECFWYTVGIRILDVFGIRMVQTLLVDILVRFSNGWMPFWILPF